MYQLNTTEQINTCESQHDALVRAGTRSSPGYEVSGTVLVICSRHCMIRKNGAGDLQLGEKYVFWVYYLFGERADSYLGIATLISLFLLPSWA